MSKNKFVIANWKMNLNPQQSVSLAKELKKLLEKEDWSDKIVVLCPSFLAISEVAKVLRDSNIALGAQDVFYEEEGAFTGEVSPENLKELNCQYVIVGHSERRAMGENDELVAKKAAAVAQHNMTPIICVGESLEERDSSLTGQVLQRQVSQALKFIEEDNYFIIAYEPVWAISTSGSGQSITAPEASKMIDIIRQAVPNKLKNFDIIYGGSVKDDTVTDFTKDFKGALVGGASLKADIFYQLIKNA